MQGFEISYTATEQCDTDDFICSSDGQCQSNDTRCNGAHDCEDGSDEDGIMCGTTLISVQMKWLTLSWQGVGKRSPMQMGPYRQLIFRTFIHLNWSAHTSYRKPPGPSSNLSSFSSTSRVMVSYAMVTFWRYEMANCRIRHCLEDSAVTSLIPQQTCSQEATICG